MTKAKVRKAKVRMLQQAKEKTGGIKAQEKAIKERIQAKRGEGKGRKDDGKGKWKGK